MNIRRAIAAGSIVFASALIASPFAHAADTTTTFTLAAGTLSISVPGSASIGSVTSGAASSASGSLGTVTVTDNRGALVAAWTATVSSTDFTTGGGSADEKVAKGSITYSSGTLTTSGAGVFTPSVNQALSAAKSAATLAGGVGNNSASWNPTLSFSFSSTQVAGTYSGTITHSVA